MPDDPAQRPEEAPLSADKTSAIVQVIGDEPTKWGTVQAFQSEPRVQRCSLAQSRKPLARVLPDWTPGAKRERVQPRGTMGARHSPAAVDWLPEKIPSSGLPTGPTAAAPHHARAPARQQALAAE